MTCLYTQLNASYLENLRHQPGGYYAEWAGNWGGHDQIYTWPQLAQ